MPLLNLRIRVAAACLFAALAACTSSAILRAADTLATVGPATGTLLIHGGGGLDDAMWNKFAELAGGLDEPFVVIPTAGERDEYDETNSKFDGLKKIGATNIAVLHTRDRDEANSPEFVAPLKSARGVWITGGRQWRLADAYLGTRVLEELRGVLARGGAIGGSSAGATIIGSYMVRGDPKGNTVMMSSGHEVGFGFLRNAIDQHFLARKRTADMPPVIHAHPELLGLGIDEKTAAIVRGNRLEVFGPSQMAVFNSNEQPDEPYILLSQGDEFDLASRRVENPR